MNWAGGVPQAPRKSPEELQADVDAYNRREAGRRVVALVESCGLPDEHVEAEQRSIESTPEHAREIWSDALDVLRSHARGQAIIGLIGPRGTGKSTAAAKVLLEECRAARPAKYVLAYEYIRACEEGQSYGAKVSESEIERRYVRPMLLVIDELHLVPATDRGDIILKTLIQRRWDAKRCTVLIANEKPDLFVARIGQSIADRMRQRGGLVTCEFKSMRRPTAAGGEER